MVDQDLSQLNSAQSFVLVGSNSAGEETNPADCSDNLELKTSDIADNGGIDSLVTVPANTTILLKVGSSPKEVRKYIQIQAHSNGFFWGFTNPATTFRAYRDQFFVLPYGPNTNIYITNTLSASGQIAIAEVS